MRLVLFLLLFPALALSQECKIKLDESNIDLHGFLRAFYSCGSLGRSFVMDHSIQRPVPSSVNLSYGRSSYAAILKEVLQPLGLKLVQGKWVDAVVLMPPESPRPELSKPLVSSSVSAPDSSSVPGLDLDLLPLLSDVPRPRRFRVLASGLLRSTARRFGLDYSELLVSASAPSRFLGRPSASQLWSVAARASDSLGTSDFARIVDYTALGDTSRVVFGGETRRPESVINYETGSALTQYASVFDGLSVDVVGDSWKFVWRGEGSVLEVPGSVGGCASGSNRVVFSSVRGVPFLSSVPVLKYFFSFESKSIDELLVSVCVEELDGVGPAVLEVANESDS